MINKPYNSENKKSWILYLSLVLLFVTGLVLLIVFMVIASNQKRKDYDYIKMKENMLIEVNRDIKEDNLKAHTLHNFLFSDHHVCLVASSDYQLFIYDMRVSDNMLQVDDVLTKFYEGEYSPSYSSLSISYYTLVSEEYKDYRFADFIYAAGESEWLDYHVSLLIKEENIYKCLIDAQTYSLSVPVQYSGSDLKEFKEDNTSYILYGLYESIYRQNANIV